MKLSSLNESDGLPHNTRVWTPEEHQGAKHKKHWYQQYYVKAKPYTWPKKTGGKEATGYKDHILPPGTVKEDILRESDEERPEKMTKKWAEELSNQWIDADEIMQGGSEYETFFFLENGQLHTKYDPENGEDKHADMLHNDEQLVKYYTKLYNKPIDKVKFSDIWQHDLLGRIGYKRLGYTDKVRIVSFWNDTPSVYSKLLESCLKEMMSRNLIDDDSFISSPIHKTVPVSTILGGKAETKEMTDEEQTDYELHSKLHLMRGQEKRDAMKKVGVDGGGKPHPMQQAMSNAGLLKPGQKWWATQSESKMPYHVKKSGDGYKVYSPNGAKSKKPLSKKKAEAQQAAIYANTHGEDIAVALDKMIGEETVTLQLDSETYREVIGLLAGGHTLEHIIENKMGIMGWKGTMMLTQLVMTH